ncbi:GcrA family cell cycle regulator [Pararhizobium sp. BT-229]|uniref:GcrA family cell cycle regulator n=1 Tax=Pararhizobium sp. BT-229 TaxID=2986923 RepID=UPI0021F755BA|nr:GcrA family cell cycle regulator [Pararhizobium sp. BT-229]MCV9960777.1 GcrA family cell cycle regulator [Pararhizobium sp. BT-229]
MKWSDIPKEERLQRVREFAKKGLSANQIACEFQGISRNAIIGFMHRNDIPLTRKRGDNRVEAAAANRKAAGQSAPKATPAKVLAKRETSFRKTPAPELAPLKIARKHAFNPLPGVAPMRIEDLPVMGRCRWPVNGEDGREGIFCGSATSPVAATYCHTHQHLSSH